MEMTQMDSNHELNDKDRMIKEKGILYYLWQYTDFLCDLPEWMIPHIEAETEHLYNGGQHLWSGGYLTDSE